MTRCQECEENPATSLFVIDVPQIRCARLLCSECIEEIRKALMAPLVQPAPPKFSWRDVLWSLVAAAIVVVILSLKDGWR